MTTTCKKCRFFEMTSDGSYCRRYPPPRQGFDENDDGYYPKVNLDDRTCGEYSPAAQSEPAPEAVKETPHKTTRLECTTRRREAHVAERGADRASQAAQGRRLLVALDDVPRTGWAADELALAAFACDVGDLWQSYTDLEYWLDGEEHSPCDCRSCEAAALRGRVLAEPKHVGQAGNPWYDACPICGGANRLHGDEIVVMAKTDDTPICDKCAEKHAPAEYAEMKRLDIDAAEQEPIPRWMIEEAREKARATECKARGRDCRQCPANECEYGPASSSCGHLPETHCPRCGKASPYLNVCRDHWCYCDGCKVRWLIGANLFSGWRDENNAVWEANVNRLRDYPDVSFEPHRTCCDNPEPVSDIGDADFPF